MESQSVERRHVSLSIVAVNSNPVGSEAFAYVTSLRTTEMVVQEAYFSEGTYFQHRTRKMQKFVQYALNIELVCLKNAQIMVQVKFNKNRGAKSFTGVCNESRICFQTKSQNVKLELKVCRKEWTPHEDAKHLLLQHLKSSFGASPFGFRLSLAVDLSEIRPRHKLSID